MKSVLISIQPYWVFLIIAKTMGWNIDKEKTVEVRKNYPKSNDWNKVVKIYCSKDKKSFAQIPKEYQPLMEKFLGKVTGEFVCDCISDDFWKENMLCKSSCVTIEELRKYLGKGINEFYSWHISNLVIYDKPRELSKFKKPCIRDCDCGGCQYAFWTFENGFEGCMLEWGLQRPPQSWCYVESEVEGE